MGWIDNILRRNKSEMQERFVHPSARMKSVLSDVPVTTSAELDRILRVGGANQSGSLVTPEIAMQHAAVYSCVNVLGQNFGMISTVLREKKSEDVIGDAKNNPLYKVFLEAPNSWMSPYEFKELALRDRLLYGNFYAQIIRVGQTIELVPLDPRGVRAYFDENNRPKFDVTITNHGMTGETRTLDKKDIFHFRGQLSADNITGLSVIQAAKASIGLSIATQDFGAHLFKNGATFKNVFTHPQALSETAHTNLKRSLDKYRGDGQHKDFVLEEGMTITPISMSAEDSQFLETRKFQRAEIASMFNIPLHKIGDLSDAAFSNISSQERSFQTDTMNPHYVNFQEAVSRCLIEEDDRSTTKLWFMNNDALRGDTETVTSMVDSRIKNGTMSPNEARQNVYNENPREGGDEFVDVTNVNTGNIAKKPEGEEDEIADENTGLEGADANESEEETS